MPRINKTEYAVLGLLNLEPMSGYDMKAFIRQSIGFFWQESYGQLYPALKKLHRQGLISKKVSTHKGRPDRHVYRITANGKRKLVEWLALEIEPAPVRIELLLKLFFGTMVEPDISIGHVETLLEQQQDRLKVFNRIEKEVMPQYIDMCEYPYWRATLEYGRHITRARVKWCRETLARVQKKAK